MCSGERRATEKMSELLEKGFVDHEKVAAECFTLLVKKLANEGSTDSKTLVQQLKWVGLMAEDGTPEKKDIKTVMNRVLGITIKMQELFIRRLMASFQQRVYELKNSNQLDPETKGRPIANFK
jgi:hypothetical protein